jgi:predicted phage replisome organizer
LSPLKGLKLSTNKKWYFLKFKEDYFQQDNVIALESLENGYIYSLIIIKLYLKSLKHDGQLKMTEAIPYRADQINYLAKSIGHDKDHVMMAINSAKSLDIVDIIESGEIFMSQLHNLIGHGSSEAERKQIYREKKKHLQIEHDGTKSGQRPPELEIENKDKSIDKVNELIEEQFNIFWNKYNKKRGKEKTYKKFVRLPKSDIDNILLVVDDYVKTTPDVKYRKDPLTYLNGKHWEDEIINDKITTQNQNHNNPWTKVINA